jgi:hypothetical protein
MRQAFSAQQRFDAPAIRDIPLNFECRDEIVPLLAALQHVYSQPTLRSQILDLIEADVNQHTRADVGREGFTYWQILVLGAVRLGCNLDYDKLQDLAENHLKLRAMMQLGPWDESTSFHWQRIRDNICLLRAETIDAISHRTVAAGHALVPEAARTTRADSTVVETMIHYPTESTLIRDGVRKIIELCLPLTEAAGLSGWRQHAHLYKHVKRVSREIDRIAARKGKDYHKRLKAAYTKLLKHSERIIEGARELLCELRWPPAVRSDIYEKDSLQAFIARTVRVQDTARRRVLKGETVPHEDKLFSIFEPHTQLYKRGKAGQPVQFGRLAMFYEDGAGFITHHYVLSRFETDSDVVVEQTRIVQERLEDRIKRASFDRGFHTPSNQVELSRLVPHVCLPKPGAKQSTEQEAQAGPEYFAGVQSHPGVESTIGSLQSGNGLKRCRDRTEVGFERYVSLAVLGRNLHTLGRMLIRLSSPHSEAARSQRAA